MILQEMKELEDAKQELTKLDSEFGREFLLDKERIFNELREEFKTFAESAGFTFSVQQNGSVLLAQYGSIELKLTFPNIDIPYMGAVTVLQFNSSSQARASWDIAIINAKSSNTGPSITVTTGRTSELESVRKSIERTRSKLPYTPMEYCACYGPHNSNRTAKKTVPSLTTALTEILES